MWMDTKLVLSYGNFFSAGRAGLLGRGAHGDTASYHVWTPESIFHYTMEGRSATDSSDQSRKKMSMAERRTVRAGHKGILFVFDIAFTNGAAIKKFLQPTALPRAQLDTKFTKVLFCQRWALSVINKMASAPFRRRVPPLLRAARLSAASDSSLFQAAQSQISSDACQMIGQHVLTDQLHLKKEIASDKIAKRKRGRPPKEESRRLQVHHGVCGTYNYVLGKFVPCAKRNLPKTSRLFCNQCNRYYHLPCFFDTHFCKFMQ